MGVPVNTLAAILAFAKPGTLNLTTATSTALDIITYASVSAMTNAGRIYRCINGGLMGVSGAPVHTSGICADTNGLQYEYLADLSGRTWSNGVTPVSGQIWSNGSYFYYCKLGGNVSSVTPSGYGETTDNGNIWEFNSPIFTFTPTFMMGDAIQQSFKSPLIGIDGNGWVVKIVLSGVTNVSGSVDATKLIINVTDPGYDSNGNPTTAQRTITGIAVLKRQRQDPLLNLAQNTLPNNNNKYMINNVNGNLEIYVAIDDFIYTNTIINSARIQTGFYTGVASDFSTSITNVSTLPYPSIIPGLVSPQFLSTEGTSAIHSEWVAFHRHARNGQQIACAKLQALSNSASGAITTLNSTTLSTIIKQGNIPEVWGADVDCSTFTQGVSGRVNAIFYPWIGNNPYDVSISGASWPSGRPQIQQYFLCDKTSAYGGAYVYVSPTGSNLTGVVSTNPLSARALPYQTLVTAISAARVYNNNNKGHNDYGGAFVRLMDNGGNPHTYYYTSAPSNTPGQTWLTIENDPLSLNTVTVSPSSSLSQWPGLIRWRTSPSASLKLTLDTISNSSFGFMGNNGANTFLMIDNISGMNTGNKSSTGWYRHNWFYNITTSSASKFNPYSFQTPSADSCNVVAGMVTDNTIGGLSAPGSTSLLLGCVLRATSIGAGTYAYWELDNTYDGRIIYNNMLNGIGETVSKSFWTPNNNAYSHGQIIAYGDNFYKFASGSGTQTGTNPPVHTTGTSSDGNANWTYLSSSHLERNLGFASVQNVYERYDASGTGAGLYQQFNDGDVTQIRNWISMYNTAIGSKCNTLYNDSSNSQNTPVGIIKQGTRKYDIIDNQNCKIDGALGYHSGGPGNYSFAYGVSNVGTISLFGTVGRTGAGPSLDPISVSYGGVAWLPSSEPALNSKLVSVSGMTMEQTYETILNMFYDVTVAWGTTPIYTTAWATGAIAANSYRTANGSVWKTLTGGTATAGNAPTGLTSPQTTADGITWYYVHALASATTLGGNYRPKLSSTYIRNRVPTGMAGLKYDISGTTRLNDGLGAAGAYEAS